MDTALDVSISILRAARLWSPFRGRHVRGIIFRLFLPFFHRRNFKQEFDGIVQIMYI